MHPASFDHELQLRDRDAFEARDQVAAGSDVGVTQPRKAGVHESSPCVPRAATARSPPRLRSPVSRCALEEGDVPNATCSSRGNSMSRLAGKHCFESMTYRWTARSNRASRVQNLCVVHQVARSFPSSRPARRPHLVTLGCNFLKVLHCHSLPQLAIPFLAVVNDAALCVSSASLEAFCSRLRHGTSKKQVCTTTVL